MHLDCWYMSKTKAFNQHPKKNVVCVCLCVVWGGEVGLRTRSFLRHESHAEHRIFPSQTVNKFSNG